MTLQKATTTLKKSFNIANIGKYMKHTHPTNPSSVHFTWGIGWARHAQEVTVLFPGLPLFSPLIYRDTIICFVHLFQHLCCTLFCAAILLLPR